MQSFQGLIHSVKESPDSHSSFQTPDSRCKPQTPESRSKPLQNLFQSVKESGDHRLSGVLATARAVQRRASDKRRPGNGVVRPDDVDPRGEIQWQAGIVNAVNRYVETVSKVFDLLSEASELLVAGGVCVMMEQTHETKPLVEHVKAARHKVCSVAEESRETLQDMANCLGACMEEFIQAERAKSEYEHYTGKVSSLSDESAKNEMARMEEETDPKRNQARSQLTEKISEKFAAHRTQSLTEKLARNQEKLQRWSLCVEESEKRAHDSWQACKGHLDELSSLAEKIVCEVVLALGSIATCGVSMRSSTTAPTVCESPKHFTINVCPVLAPSESGRIEQISVDMEDTDAALSADGPLHVDAKYPDFRQSDEELQQNGEQNATGGDLGHASESIIHSRPESRSEFGEFGEYMDVPPEETGLLHCIESHQLHVQTVGKACGFDDSKVHELSHTQRFPFHPDGSNGVFCQSWPPPHAASGCVVGQKGVSSFGQDPNLLVMNEHALVRIQGESVLDASAVTIFIGTESCGEIVAMPHPTMNLQLKPSFSDVLIGNPQNIPVQLGEASKSIHRKLKAITMLGDDLFSLNEAVFNVPVGSRIDADATFHLFQLMEQVHLYFQHGKYNKTDPNFLRDYVALLGTMQNQPFFGSQQGRAFRTWMFEALLSAGADQHEHQLDFKL